MPKIEGSINLQDGYIFIDAIPSIMTRIRQMFKNLSWSNNRGKYTKNVIKIPKNNLNAKDILWLCMRYGFDRLRCEDYRSGFALWMRYGPDDDVVRITDL